MSFDFVVRNADVATASDRFRADLGIQDGRIVAIGQGPGPPAARSSTPRVAW